MARVAVFLIGVGLILLLSSSPGSAVSYQVTSVMCSQSGGSPVQVNVAGISSSASNPVIVGQWLYNNTSHAYYAQVSGATTIGTCTLLFPDPNTTWARAIGIDPPATTIVGFHFIGSGRSRVQHGFTYNKAPGGAFYSFNIQGGYTVPDAINAQGIVVGSYQSGGVFYGFAATSSVSGGQVVVDYANAAAISGASSITGISDGSSCSSPANACTYTFVGDGQGKGASGVWGTISYTGTGFTTPTVFSFNCSGFTSTSPKAIAHNGSVMAGNAANKGNTTTVFTYAITGSPSTNTSAPCDTGDYTSSIPPGPSTAFTGINPDNTTGTQFAGNSSGAQNGVLLTP